MITCEKFETFILDYLDGNLPWAQRVVFNMHLAMCAECRRYLAAYRQARALGQAVLQPVDDALPPDVPDDLIRAVLEATNATEEP